MGSDRVEAGKKLWVFLVEEEDGREGIVAVQARGFASFPLVTSHEGNLASLREAAAWHKQQTGRPVRLYEFTERALIEEL